MQCAACPDDAVVQWAKTAPDDAGAVTVFACAVHAITLDAAAQTHAPDCTAPQPGTPTPCCTPLPPPPADPDPGPINPLPPGWT
jgi:hypothetical protein